MWWFRAEAWTPRGISSPSLALLLGPIHSSLLEVLLFEGAPAVCLFILYVFSLFLHFRWEYRLLYKTEKYKRAVALSPFLLKIAPASSSLCFLPKFCVHIAPCIAGFLETLKLHLAFFPTTGPPCRAENSFILFDNLYSVCSHEERAAQTCSHVPLPSQEVGNGVSEWF